MLPTIPPTKSGIDARGALPTAMIDVVAEVGIPVVGLIVEGILGRARPD